MPIKIMRTNIIIVNVIHNKALMAKTFNKPTQNKLLIQNNA